jgi:hypothetical protein
MLMNGLMWEATLTMDPAAPSPGRLVVMLENQEVLSPEDAAFGEFHIVEATEAERDGLHRAGYSLPNWEPGISP